MVSKKSLNCQFVNSKSIKLFGIDLTEMEAGYELIDNPIFEPMDLVSNNYFQFE